MRKKKLFFFSLSLFCCFRRIGITAALAALACALFFSLEIIKQERNPACIKKNSRCELLLSRRCRQRRCRRHRHHRRAGEEFRPRCSRRLSTAAVGILWFFHQREAFYILLSSVRSLECEIEAASLERVLGRFGQCDVRRPRNSNNRQRRLVFFSLPPSPSTPPPLSLSATKKQKNTHTATKLRLPARSSRALRQTILLSLLLMRRPAATTATDGG